MFVLSVHVLILHIYTANDYLFQLQPYGYLSMWYVFSKFTWLSNVDLCRLEGTVLTTNKQAGYTRCYRSYIDNHNTILEIYKYFFT